MKLKYIFNFSTFYAFVVFVLSMQIFPFYVYGDQEHYIKFYEGIQDRSITDAYSFYGNTVGAQEPVYFLIIYLFNTIIDKMILMSLINSLMFYFISKYLAKINVHPFIIFSLLFNYYILVLFFSAERLKIAILFTVLYMYYNKKNIAKLFFILAALSHLQAIILLFVTKVNWILKYLKSIFSRDIMKTFIGFFLLLGVSFVAFKFMSNQVISKYSSYSDGAGLLNFVKPAIFLILNFFYAQDKKVKVLIIHTPLIVASLLLEKKG